MADSEGVLVVFTAKTVEQVLANGGTQSWVLNEQSMRRVTYVVCTRNSDHQHDEECGVRTEEHNSAFIVGKVSGLRKVDHRNDRDRYLVEFSDYALVEVPNFRRGSSRNPVTYSDVAQCRLKGIDFSKLTFVPMPGSNCSVADVASPKIGLTISAAKEGLAAYFGVSVESVQITINA